jgi:hypothetical protein
MRTGEFTDNQNAAFPYILASKEDQTIFAPDCVPEGFVLSDPDHLQAVHVRALYLHWLKRQEKKLPAFIILNCSPQHQKSERTSAKAKGKRKMEYLEVNSDDEEVESEREDERLEEEEEESKEEEEEEREQSEEGEEKESKEEEEEEEEEREQSEEGEEELSEGGDRLEDNNGMEVVKYGPPIAMKKKHPPSTPLNLQAGPSKPVPQKLVSKKDDVEISVRRLNTRHSAKNPNPKKRKPEEDLAIAPPLKTVKKSNEVAKSGKKMVQVRIQEAEKVSDSDEA